MRKPILVAMTAVVVLALVTLAMAADPHFGTWKLNVAKSTVRSGPPDKSGVVTITAQDNGIRLVGDSVDTEGSPAMLSLPQNMTARITPTKEIQMQIRLLSRELMPMHGQR